MRGDVIFWFWGITVPCTVVASVLELWMRWRLAIDGYRKRVWDVTLY